MKLAISRIFFYFGIFLILLALVHIAQRYNPKRLSFDNYQENLNTGEGSNQILESSLSSPKYLVIKDLDISLPVFSANPPKNGHWATTYEGVSFLNSSVIPGNRGNSIMYGHNWSSLLGKLKNAKPGMTVEVVFENGSNAKFNIQYIQVVPSNQSDILNDTDDVRLTIYTCTGILDSKRLVVTAISSDAQ